MGEKQKKNKVKTKNICYAKRKPKTTTTAKELHTAFVGNFTCQTDVSIRMHKYICKVVMSFPVLLNEKKKKNKTKQNMCKSASNL